MSRRGPSDTPSRHMAIQLAHNPADALGEAVRDRRLHDAELAGDVAFRPVEAVTQKERLPLGRREWGACLPRLDVGEVGVQGGRDYSILTPGSCSYPPSE